MGLAGEGLRHLCRSGGVAARQACVIVRREFAPEKIVFRPFGETVTREKKRPSDRVKTNFTSSPSLPNTHIPYNATGSCFGN